MNWTIATVIAAGIAASVNFAAAWMQWKHRQIFQLLGVAWTSVYLFSALFAWFYVVMFGALEWADLDRAAWSRALTPFASLVFLTVWTAPALLGMVKVATFRGHGETIARGLLERPDDG